ncbi:MAG: DUF4097 family beta strand repeat protein [Clostridia bacterium]|nr:DUF4097 family beta strand repeat protein [Clostridia bacterium]
MSKRTKIMMILGAVIMAAGFVICIVGAIISNVHGDQLFAAKTDEGKGYTYTFSGQEINKIDIEAADATVNIIGGANESKIELINFNENFYSFNCSNRLITFKESPDISSVLRFWESGFTFKGMRYILRFDRTQGEKTINIYLTNRDYVKNFTVSVGKGKIAVEDIGTETDYNFALTDGIVDMNNIHTTSVISIAAATSSDMDIIMKNVSAKTLNINAAYAEVKSETLSFGGGKLSIAHGSAQLDFIPGSEYFKMKVNANGKLTVNEHSFISSFEYKKLPEITDEEPDKDSETTAPDVSNITIDGRELAVYLTGDCFADIETETPQE